MESSEISLPVNQFGFRLLSDLTEQEEAESLLVSPPALFLGLALLKSAAAGATRGGLARLLGTDESLSEEERERRVCRLRESLTRGATFCLANVLRVNSYRPLSPSFLRRAASVYGAQVQQEESSLPLHLQSCLQGKLSLSASVPALSLRESPLLGVRFATTNPQQGLYVFMPDRVPFWQGRRKSLQSLLNLLNAQTWPSWHEAIQAQKPGPEWGLPALETSAETDLKALDLGPASTASADFSRLVASGNAPSLSSLHHQVQLSFTYEKGFRVAAQSLPDQPLIWLLSEESTGVILALGLQP